MRCVVDQIIPITVICPVAMLLGNVKKVCFYLFLCSYKLNSTM